MRVEGLGEFGLLERIKPYLSAHAGQDDAAVLEDADGFVVASCDMFVEGVHFDLAWMRAEDAGWRSLALALGDLAAKGATPWWALTSIALPDAWAVETLTGLYAGIAELAQQTRVLIAGGDMSSTDGPAVLSITVVGRTERRPLARSEARPGWVVAVTGPLGASATALRDGARSGSCLCWRRAAGSTRPGCAAVTSPTACCERWTSSSRSRAAAA